MKLKFTLLLLLAVFDNQATYSQLLNVEQLENLFNSLEERNEAMGSIAIAENGQLLYKRAFGYRCLSNDTLLPADTTTKYRIWSTTKTYTATMIMQLIDEGKLSLETTLDNFYSQLPNASEITIESMLGHKSGIHDFTQNKSNEDWDSDIDEPMSQEFMVKLISSYKADFQPNEKMQYSNSNYLLLGYIIEKLDSASYGNSLFKRISSKIGLTRTHFRSQGLDMMENKAFSYQYRNQWKEIDEGGFSGQVPGGAGGILSTPGDMVRFIEALFSGKLISANSLAKMIDGDGLYRLGIMKTYFGEKMAYGHTGGNKASESSLFYYPEDSLAIAYCTNGIVIRKEEILNHVLAIHNNLPFAVSMNRKFLGLFILFGMSILLIVGLQFKPKTTLTSSKLLSFGLLISLIFWTGVVTSGVLIGDHNHLKDDVTILSSFYSASGTFMSGVQFVVALLSFPFTIGLYMFCKKMKLSFLPILPILIFAFSMAGSSLFPYPNQLQPIFVNVNILTIFGPLLAILMWQNKKLKLISIASLILMLSSIVLLNCRSSFPVFVGEHFGLIQRLLYLGLTFWFASLSFYSVKEFKLKKS